MKRPCRLFSPGSIMNRMPGSIPEADCFEILLMLIEKYESEHYPVLLPDSIESIRFRMEQRGLTVKDMEPHVGESNRVYEVLSGKRQLTLPMIRRLHKGLGIPAERKRINQVLRDAMGFIKRAERMLDRD